MSISAVDNFAPASSPYALSGARTGPISSSGSDFSSILARADRKTNATPAERARSAAQQFVAVALVQPLLKQLRETSMAAPPFAPTSGEKQFQSLYDAEIAQRLVSAAHFPLVDRLAHDLLNKGRQEPQISADRAKVETAE